MAKGSCFLFHNEDHFFYGELSVEEVAILEDVSEKMRAELSSKKK